MLEMMSGRSSATSNQFCRQKPASVNSRQMDSTGQAGRAPGVYGRPGILHCVGPNGSDGRRSDAPPGMLLTHSRLVCPDPARRASGASSLALDRIEVRLDEGEHLRWRSEAGPQVGVGEALVARRGG